MGNREDLLAGAKRCLIEKGYTATTARDVATAAGTSLAAIGYHFRTTKALLNEALIEAMAEWGEELGRALAEDAGPTATPAQRFEAAWERILESFARLPRLWAIQFELIAQLDRVPELREAFAAANRQARLGLAEVFHRIDPAADEPTALALGAFHQALLGGLAAQWLVDPAAAPSAAELTRALRAVADEFRAGQG
ncbi:TetR/AcrR family transcriptional regulator [Micromonospora sp. DR5-3]|uniref:TetR/AcrR family transcriptional regulator n=1 Tax=unclassified Micromonospora TaxID=2617518 RepID=UPI0011D9EC77|nr:MULTISPECIES: TetR/AcrR family transcriptional regulator [unclassified Micromonospora]MCW3817699.1 TetR/AcrR family transcriptional regulator [Micromonospora sp. DR5-3]TYC24972.1 TetR/AcrR family transcriptional regulator [Micromonospora sp. MP36]